MTPQRQNVIASRQHWQPEQFQSAAQEMAPIRLRRPRSIAGIRQNAQLFSTKCSVQPVYSILPQCLPNAQQDFPACTINAYPPGLP